MSIDRVRAFAEAAIRFDPLPVLRQRELSVGWSYGCSCSTQFDLNTRRLQIETLTLKQDTSCLV